MEDYNNDFESIMIAALKDSSLIKHDIPTEVFGEISAETVKTLTNSLSSINIEGDGFIAVTDSGDEIHCPNFGVSVEQDGKWLSDLIPAPNFDTDMNGNVRKAIEAESAYTCAIIAGILKSDIFKEEILNICSNYDFNKMDVKDNNFSNFSSLLNDWIDLQSFEINVIVSATKFKIFNRKKDTAKFLRDGIPEDSAIELRNLDIRIKNINREYSTGELSPVNVKTKTKIDILKLLNEKLEKINKLIDDSNVKTLYTILNLSTEYISPIDKLKLTRLAMSEVEKFYASNDGVSDSLNDKNIIMKKWKRKYLKIAKLSRRKEEVLKYLSSPEDYKLPVKR